MGLRCIICYRELGGEEKTLEAKEDSRNLQRPWLAWGQSAYPLCDDYGLNHLKRKIPLDNG